MEFHHSDGAVEVWAEPSTRVSPHGFKPLRFWDRLHRRGRCARCYLPRSAHPRRDWCAARHLGDRSPATRPGEARGEGGG
jgi:hypothetical protein